MDSPKYPEHQKLKAVQAQSQIIHEFVLEFLQRKGISLAKYAEDDTRIVWESKPLSALVAEFFELDLKKLEQEKLLMIEECRTNDKAKKSG